VRAVAFDGLDKMGNIFKASRLNLAIGDTRNVVESLTLGAP
jgi:hypothetical protein